MRKVRMVRSLADRTFQLRQEPLRSLGLLVLVRVPAQGFPAVGLLDLLRRGVPLESEDLVVVRVRLLLLRLVGLVAAVVGAVSAYVFLPVKRTKLSVRLFLRCKDVVRFNLCSLIMRTRAAARCRLQNRRCISTGRLVRNRRVVSVATLKTT